MNWMILIGVLIIGLITGELANLLIDRLPVEDREATPNGCCPLCEHKLAWYEQLPIFSFLLRKGRCHYCGEKISKRYIFVNLANGILYSIIYIRFANSMNTIPSMIEVILFGLCATALLVVTVVDWNYYEIPVALNIFIFVLGLIRILLDRQEWLQYVIGFFAVSGLLYLILLITKGRGIGGGDVKLMAAAGLLLGWKSILIALVLGSILGSIIHLSIMAIKKSEHMLAFGPYLSLGIFLSILWGEQLVSWYQSLLGF